MPEVLHQKIRDSEENYMNKTFWNVYPLFLMIRSGDRERLKESLHLQLDAFPAGRITRNEKKQLEYLAVSLVNTFMIAAIEGGVYPPDANAAADQALRLLSQTHSTAGIPEIVHNAAVQLCEMTAAIQQGNTGNAHVEKAKRFIESHLTQEIRTEDIAAFVGISACRLSHVFKAVTGQTLKGYLTQERIRTAKQLLSARDYTIPQIASLLRFCDQSYFTRVFRQMEGVTPNVYRDWHAK